MLDLGSVLEAGLKLNAVAHHALGTVSDTFQSLALPSDCCSSNNYPTPPQ